MTRRINGGTTATTPSARGAAPPLPPLLPRHLSCSEIGGVRPLPCKAGHLGSSAACYAVEVQYCRDNVIKISINYFTHFQRCAKCKLPYYCGSTCQRAAWKLGHKVECKYLASVAPRVPPPLVLLLLRTLQRASINSAYKETLPYGSRGLTDLWAHEKKIEKSEQRREAFLAYLPVVAACVGDKYTQGDLWINYCRYIIYRI